MTAHRRSRTVVTVLLCSSFAAAVSSGCAQAPLQSQWSEHFAVAEPATLPPRGVADERSATDTNSLDPTALYEAEIAENLRRGDLEADANRPEQAARFYERVLREDPRHAGAHHRLGVVSDLMGRFAAAERHYLAALDQRPHDADLLNDLGYSYLLQSKYAESERLLRQAIAADPTHERALTNLGLLYGTLGDQERALAVLRRTSSEEEAQAKLIALLSRHQDSSPSPDRDSLAPPPPVARSVILQIAGITEETTDFTRKRPLAELDQPPSRIRSAARLPGLIEPNPEGPQPYIRGRAATALPIAQEPGVIPPSGASASLVRPASPHDLPLWNPSAATGSMTRQEATVDLPPPLYSGDEVHRLPVSAARSANGHVGVPASGHSRPPL